tara:strand:+ start:95373 stop:95525 length:153 start_codon:yes stop_codon:yes gene_type:complete
MVLISFLTACAPTQAPPAGQQLTPKQIKDAQTLGKLRNRMTNRQLNGTDF